MRTFTIDFCGDKATLVGYACNLDGMRFVTNYDVCVGQILEESPNRINHPFRLEMDMGGMVTPSIYPIERGHVRELARRISSECCCCVNVIAAARILIRYKNGELVKEYNIHDFYVMSKEEAKMYQL